MSLRKLSPFLSTLGVLFATLAVEPQNAPALAGRWEGTLLPKPQRQRGSRALLLRPPLPMVVTITTVNDGTHSGTWVSTSQNGSARIGEIKIAGETVRISVPAWSASWEGTLSADGSKLEGSWKQNGRISPPFVLTKVATQ